MHQLTFIQIFSDVLVRGVMKIVDLKAQILESVGQIFAVYVGAAARLQVTDREELVVEYDGQATLAVIHVVVSGVALGRGRANLVNRSNAVPTRDTPERSANSIFHNC